MLKSRGSLIRWALFRGGVAKLIKAALWFGAPVTHSSPFNVNNESGRSEWSPEVVKEFIMEAHMERTWMEGYLDGLRARVC